MKKVFFITFLSLLAFTNLNAQKTSFGASSGFHMLTAKASYQGVTASESASGFYLGLFAEVEVSEKFKIQPELLYASTFKDGESGNEIIIPVMGKYYVSEKFNIQAGPQFDYIIDESDGVYKVGLGLGLGLGLNISEKVFAVTRYSLGLTNRLQDAPSGLTTKFNTFQIGLGYRF